MAKSDTKQRRAVHKPNLNVLFVGNSFTARNDLPGMIAKLTAGAGMALHHSLINIGGASLRTHWNRGAAQEEIRTNHYDYVVLQEQSTLPVKNPGRMHENVRLFDAVIKASGARTSLYMTWARQHEPKNQDRIVESYSTIGAEIGATVIPVGLVWQRFLKRHDHPLLYDRDGSHPSVAGTCLAAGVFFAELFGRTPAGFSAEVPSLTAAEVHLLLGFSMAKR